jgi:cell division protein FtsN
MRSLSALLFIVLISLPSCKFIRKKGWFGTGKADALIVMQARQDSIRVADSIKLEVEMMKKIEQARLDSIKMVEAEKLEYESKFKYHIIVGSFLTPEYAENYKNYYISRGYDAKIIPDSRGRFNLVSAEVNESLSKAIQRLKRYQDTVDFESWIFVKN